MPGIQVGGIFNRTLNDRVPPKKSPLQAQYDQYGGAVDQNNADYSNIMGAYTNMLGGMANNPIKLQGYTNPQQFTPQTYNYQESPELRNAISNLQTLSASGGYSADDIANLRERGISPIRAVYANAQRNINRQKSLQGGYSPNYTAATANMARDQADQIAGQTTNVNADIAQKVAAGKLAMAPELAKATEEESNLRNQYASKNADIINEANRFNLMNAQDVNQRNTDLSNQSSMYSFQLPMDILSSMTKLYGTTPARSALFGSQAMNAANMQGGFNRDASNNFFNLFKTLGNS